METLNYKELKKEFRKKEQAERRGKGSRSYETADLSNLKDGKRHNLKTKQDYWLYLLEQKNG